MADERGRNKKKREQKKIERLQRFFGIDLCACGGGNQIKCHGVCRESHTNSKTGKIECEEMYYTDRPPSKQSGSRSQKRSWRYGRQKDVDENKLGKQQHRDKRERDRSN